MGVLADKILPIYHHLLPDLLDIAFPDETIATCNNCNLCQSAKSPYQTSKCCNYHPSLPNYLVGALLNDHNPDLNEGKKRILSKISEQTNATPFGITAPLAYLHTQKEILTINRLFQHQDDLEIQLCPYYDRGNCSVWAYRDHLCVTYFCTSIGGSNGHSFWKTLDGFLAEVEHCLAKFCAQHEGFTVLSNPHDPLFTSQEAEKFALLTEAPFFDAVDFYKRSASLLANLTQHDFLKLFDPLHYQESVLKIKEAATLFRASCFPNRLMLHPDLIVSTTKNGEIDVALNHQHLIFSPVTWLFIKQFDGSLSTPEVFKIAFKVLYNLQVEVEDLLEKGMLITSNR